VENCHNHKHVTFLVLLITFPKPWPRRSFKPILKRCSVTYHFFYLHFYFVYDIMPNIYFVIINPLCTSPFWHCQRGEMIMFMMLFVYLCPLCVYFDCNMCDKLPWFQYKWWFFIAMTYGIHGILICIVCMCAMRLWLYINICYACLVFCMLSFRGS